MDALFELAGQLCHGEEDTLFCHRCTGVWAGAALALPIVFFLRRKVPLWLWIVLAVAFIQMPVLGYGRIPLPDEVKTISGQVFAVSVVFGLALHPARRWFKPLGSERLSFPLVIITAAGIAALQVLLHSEMFFLLDAMCLVGLIASIALVLLHILSILLPVTSFRK